MYLELPVVVNRKTGATDRQRVAIEHLASFDRSTASPRHLGLDPDTPVLAVVTTTGERLVVPIVEGDSISFHAEAAE